MLCSAAAASVIAVMAVWGLQLLDDGYYYLQVAWNISRGAGSSFDSINATNGYHPLWQLTLVPLHWLFQKASAAWAAVVLQTLLFAGSGLLLHRLVLRAGGTALSAAAACAVWVLNFWLWGKGAMSGMETGLLLLLVGLSLLLLLRVLRTGRGGWKLGVLLALAAAARLDSLALAASSVVVLLVAGRRRAAAGAAVVPAGYLAVYLPVNALLFGGATPVSGWIKSETGRRLLRRLVEHGDASVLVHAMENVHGLVSLGGRLPWLLWGPGLAALAAVAVLARRRASPELRGLMEVCFGYAVLLVGFYSIMYPSLLGAYTYYWLPPLFCLVAVAFAAAGLLPRAVRRWALAAVLLLFVLFEGVYAADRLGSWSFTVLESERPDAAGVRYLNSLEGDVVVGSWDAGYVGYRCRHPVVNLDGLVSSYRYQRVLKEGGLAEWIRRQGITHLANVDYYAGKRQLIEEELEWQPVFADTAEMPRPVSVFSLSPSDLEYASRRLRVFYVYRRPGDS